MMNWHGLEILDALNSKDIQNANDAYDKVLNTHINMLRKFHDAMQSMTGARFLNHLDNLGYDVKPGSHAAQQSASQ